MEDTDIYDECVVTFIDILGFRAQVDADDPTLIRSHLRLLRRVTGVEEPDSVDLSFHAFSDSIVRIRKIVGSVAETIGLEANDIGLAQLDLTHRGVLIRGGLTVGKVYSDRDVVFGPAMIRAYDIENTMAKNPIVMIDPALRQALSMSGEFPDQLGLNGSSSPIIAIPEDGEPWIDYLSIARHELDEDADLLESLVHHKRMIEQGLAANKDSARTFPKYEWLASYHNDFCMGYSHVDALSLLVKFGLSVEMGDKLEVRVKAWRKRPYGDTHDLCASEHDGREEDDFDEEDDFGELDYRDNPIPS